jgi:hypothetical protein
VPSTTVGTTAQPPPPPAPPRRLVAWPAGRNGYTVVLASEPTRRSALRRARQALREGLRDSGVLSSSQYSSLRPGYFVAFAGIYRTLAAAQTAADRARDRGFDGAYASAIAS